MAKRPMSIIAMMNFAWEQRQQYLHEEMEEKFKNLISHAFVEYEDAYKAYCASEGIDYNERIFVAFQHIIVFLTFSDGQFLQGEYDAYVKYCNWARIKPLTAEDCKSLFERLPVEDVATDIQLLTCTREFIDPDNYFSMVMGLCYFTLFGDKSFDENEFYIIKMFFEQGYDYCPSTWEQFKAEWN